MHLTLTFSTHADGGTRRMYVRFGSWLDGLSAFDAAAFRLSPRQVCCSGVACPAASGGIQYLNTCTESPPTLQ